MVDEEVACRPRSHQPLIHFQRASSPRSSLLPFILQHLFRVTNMSNRTSIKYPGTTTSTSEIHINNMYIRYTFLLDVAVLQIRQVLWAIPLPVTFSLAVKAFSIRLRTALVFFVGAVTFLPPFLKCPFCLDLPFLNLVVLLTINTWCSFLISTSADFNMEKSSSNYFVTTSVNSLLDSSLDERKWLK